MRIESAVSAMFVVLLRRKERAHRLLEARQHVRLDPLSELGRGRARVAHDTLRPLGRRPGSGEERTSAVLYDGPFGSDGLRCDREYPRRLEETGVTVGRGGILSAKLVDKVVVRKDDHSRFGVEAHRLVRRLPERRHVTALGV